MTLGKKEAIRRLSASVPMKTHMEINGNTEAVVEGCGGVLEYSEESVRIRAGKMIVRFAGRGLTIKCLTSESLVITGFLTGIEYLL